MPFLLRECIFSKSYQKSEEEDKENDFPFEISISGGSLTNQFTITHTDEFLQNKYL